MTTTNIKTTTNICNTTTAADQQIVSQLYLLNSEQRQIVVEYLDLYRNVMPDLVSRQLEDLKAAYYAGLELAKWMRTELEITSQDILILRAGHQ